MRSLRSPGLSASGLHLPAGGGSDGAPGSAESKWQPTTEKINPCPPEAAAFTHRIWLGRRPVVRGCGRAG